MAMDMLAMNNLLIDNIPGASPPGDTPIKEPIDLQQPDLTFASDPTKAEAHLQGVGVANAGGKVYGKATG
jgi:hypothetical protein